MEFILYYNRWSTLKIKSFSLIAYNYFNKIQSIYFMLGLSYTFISIIWFIIANYCKENKKIYAWINFLANTKIALNKLFKFNRKTNTVKDDSKIEKTKVETFKNDYSPIDCKVCGLCEKCTEEKEK